MMTIRDINWRQPKYMLPAIAYLPLLFIGYFVCQFFDIERPETSDGMETTEYLNSKIPDANVKNNIGDKRSNVSDAFGYISDASAVQNSGEDADSLLKRKEAFTSTYTQAQLDSIARADAQRQELEELRKALKESQERIKALQDGQKAVAQPTEAERAAAQERRKKEFMDDLDHSLGNMRRSGRRFVNERLAAADSTAKRGAEGTQDAPDGFKEKDGETSSRAVTALDNNSVIHTVIKKLDESSRYFNTLSENTATSSMIHAIIDEEVKAVDGSRVRLRLLDDIEINGVSVKRGTHLYAMMSGFSKQRVKGRVESLLIGDQLMKISLSLYDSDGMEGLYVPESAFRETAKDIGSSALNGGSMNFGTSYGGSTNVLDMASNVAGQAIQNAYQRTTQAVSKAIRKNKVRLKYGTHVYLVNKKN